MTREVHPRILIVEDEKDIVQVLEYALRQAGFDTVSARDGAEAFARVRERTPDAVILDLMLPDLSGTEICRQLKSAARTAAVPVIMLTARSDEVDRVVGFELGADANGGYARQAAARKTGQRPRSDRDGARAGLSDVRSRGEVDGALRTQADARRSRGPDPRRAARGNASRRRGRRAEAARPTGRVRRPRATRVAGDAGGGAGRRGAAGGGRADGGEECWNDPPSGTGRDRPGGDAQLRVAGCLRSRARRVAPATRADAAGARPAGGSPRGAAHARAGAAGAAR